MFDPIPGILMRLIHLYIDVLRTQIMLVSESIGEKKFLALESTEGEFETLFEVLHGIS